MMTHLPENETAFHNYLDSVVTPCIPVQLMAGKLRVGLDVDELHRDNSYVYACTFSTSCTGKLTGCSGLNWHVSISLCKYNPIMKGHQPTALIQSCCLRLLKRSLEHDFMRRLKEACKAWLIGAAIWPASAAFSPAQPYQMSFSQDESVISCFNIIDLATVCT